MSGSSSSGSSSGENMFNFGSNYQNAASSSFNQNIDPAQAEALKQLYGQAQGVFGGTNATSQGMVPGAVNYQNQVAQGAQTANQANMQGGVYGGLNIGNQLMSSLQQSQNAPSQTQKVYNQMMGMGNSYLGPLKASMMQNEANAQALNSATIDAKAAASGMSGGSRQGTEDALMRTLGNQQLTNAENQMGYSTYDTALQNRLGIAQQADASNLARQQMMSGMLGQQQGTINQGIGTAGNVQGYGMGQFNAANAPWQGMQNYQSAIGRPTVLSQGTASDTGYGKSWGSGMGKTSGHSKSGGGGI